jgi:hypothetical protein
MTDTTEDAGRTPLDPEALLRRLEDGYRKRGDYAVEQWTNDRLQEVLDSFRFLCREAAAALREQEQALRDAERLAKGRAKYGAGYREKWMRAQDLVKRAFPLVFVAPDTHEGEDTGRTEWLHDARATLTPEVPDVAR